MLSSTITASSLGFLSLLQGVLAQPRCRRVVFEVTATAENQIYLDLPDPDDSASIIKYVNNGIANGAPTGGTEKIEGTYNIVGYYCQPPARTHPKGVLQYYIHGATYNQTVWTGLGLGSEYNWIRSATQQGYHTLTLDSLGHGENPDRPDPFSVVQSSLQTEINHQILSSIRNSPKNPLQRIFDNIVLMAHSYGSSVGVNLLRLHPTDVEAFVMTGWSTTLSADATIALDYAPGSDVYSGSRLNGLAKGYITPRTANARQGGFYAGDFDPSILEIDFNGGDTVGVAEILSIGMGLQPATEFSGPVLAVNGEMDALLCDPHFGSCSEILERTGSLFPAADDYQYYVASRTGHDLSLHHSSQKTAEVIAKWLNNAGF